MKSLLAAWVVGIVFGNVAYAADVPCDSRIHYNSIETTLMEAGNGFGDRLKALLNSCEVQKLVHVEGADFSVQSFTVEPEKVTLKYHRTEFPLSSDRKNFNCVLTETRMRVAATSHEPGGPAPTMMTTAVKRTNDCVDLDNPQNFVCQKGWINCMPIVPEDRVKYCSRAYADWAKKNCGGEPLIAQ